MAATVTYDGQQPWGIYPPYVSINRESSSFGQNWYETRTIQLEGRLTESMISALGIGGLEAMRTAIENAFATNDKVFKVLSSGGSFTEYDNTYVNSISFPIQRWSKILTYSIELTSYNFHYCDDPTQVGSGCEGGKPAILNPVDQFEVQMNANQTVTLSHSVSAKGMDGFANTDVISWVQSRIAVGNNREVPGWSLEKYQYITTSESEQVNRFEGSYSHVKKYLIHKLDGEDQNSPKPFVRYSAVVNEGTNQDYPVVSVNGFVKGGRDTSMNDVRTEALAKLRESDLHAVATSMLIGAGFSDALSTMCNNYSLDEDESIKTVKAKATFEATGTDDLCPFNHDVSVEIDWITGVSRVEVDGELRCKGGTTSRNSSINSFLAANPQIKTYLYGFANAAYNDVASNVGLGTQSLNPEATDLQITRNEKKGTLRLSASYNDERFLSEYTSLRWDITAKTSVPYVKTSASGQPGTNGYWSVQSFNFSTRWRLAVNLSATHREDGSVSEALKENFMRTGLYGLKASLFTQYGIGAPLCVGGPPCYITSQNDNIDVTSVTSGSISEERSFPATLPLIDINIASMLTPPQPR